MADDGVCKDKSKHFLNDELTDRIDAAVHQILGDRRYHDNLRSVPLEATPALDALAQGLARRRVLHGVFFSHLGSVAVADLVPLFADFGLQAEGVEWSVVSGVVGAEVHISIRNVGYVRSAGEIARAACTPLEVVSATCGAAKMG